MPLFNYAGLEKLRERTQPRYWLDLGALEEQVLPYLLRRPRLLAFARALLAPAAELYGTFLSYTIQTRHELSYNGQTMQLERALNDRFDPALRRIQIINTQTYAQPVYLNFEREQQAETYVFTEAEGQPLYLSTYAEQVGQVGFTVRVPAVLRAQELALRTRINQLKIALVKYRIIYFY
jgi:hypothetical protein